MKAKVIRKFIDLKANKTRNPGEIFEVTQKRFEEINSTSFGPLVEEMKKEKEAVNNE